MFADTACLAITTERSCVDTEMREEKANCTTDRKLAKIMLTAALSRGFRSGFTKMDLMTT